MYTSTPFWWTKTKKQQQTQSWNPYSLWHTSEIWHVCLYLWSSVCHSVGALLRADGSRLTGWRTCFCVSHRWVRCMHKHTHMLSHDFLMCISPRCSLCMFLHAESDSAVCDDFLELCDDTDRALLIRSCVASRGGHMSKNTSCPYTHIHMTH